MPLPNIIAGPILRRVENNSVSVWIAFTQNVNLTLKLYEGDQVKVTGSTGNFSTTSALEITTTSAQASTIQIGKSLWVAVVTAKTQVSLQTNRIYSYTIQYTVQDNEHIKGDLRTEGLLSNEKHDGFPQLALGYKPDILPSFVLPSAEPDKLMISQASCRKMHGHGQDALSYLDKVIKDNLAQTEKRPQQLFLTGDQVYADDVPGPLLRWLPNILDEKVQIDKADGSMAEVKVDITNFPPYLRQDIITDNAGMSSGAASNHVISFGEFCALYLNCWCIRSWNLKLVGILERIQKDNRDSTLTEEVLNLLDNSTGHDPDILLKTIYQDPDNLRSPLFKLHFDKDSNAKYQLNPVDVDNPSKQQERFDLWLEKVRSSLKGELKEMAVFSKALPKVSRVLANVPCYMIFDDHEITDDWYLSQRWKNHVLSKHLGRDIIRSGLMAYTVFQDWGNVPDEYVLSSQASGNETNHKAQLLREISGYAFEIGGELPGSDHLIKEKLESIEETLGMGDQASKVKWHYSVNTGPTKSYILDTRTRREYASLNSPPGLLSEEALLEQVPDTIPNGNAPFTFIISPAPVLGLGSFEELIQPAAAAVAGISNSTGRNPGVLVGMLEADYEAWGFSPKSFEALIERLSKLKKVIILSGDVHYGFSSMLDYWKGNSTTPEARIVQFTSSALKNEEYGIVHLYRSAMAQKMMTGIGDNLEKLGWNNRVLTLTGEVSMKNRFRLRQNPAVIPIAGWQPGATVNLQPDYRWRLKMLTDNSVRASDPFTSDFLRAAGEDDESFVLVNDNTTQEGYRKIVQRHQDNFISGVHRRMVWPANIGILKFEDDGGVWKVKHDYLFIQGKRSGFDSEAKAHIKHEVSLVANLDDANRPELP